MLGLRSIYTSIPLVSVVALTAAPRPADACLPDPCTESNRFIHFELANTIVAPNGVLRIDARQNIYLYNGAPLEDALAFAELTVTDEGGLLAEGSLEYQPEVEAIVWRPTLPLSPNGTYDVEIRVDNEALALALDDEWIAEESWCGEDIIGSGVIHVSASMLPELSIPDPDVESSHHVDPLESLTTLVCCDGAYPEQDSLTCDIDEPINVWWDTGTCAATQGYGTVRAVESYADDIFPAHVANDLVLTLVQTDGYRIGRATPGQLSASIEHDEPFCASLDVVSLTTGERWTGPEHCHGGDLADQLDRHELDPSEGLAACETQAYVCEVAGDAWDPANCEPWGDPPGEDDTGGSNGSGGDDATETDGDGDGDGDSGDGGGGSGGTDTTPQDGDDGLIGPGCACRARGGDSTPAGLWLLIAGLAWRRARRPRVTRPRS